jgi:uncharacterized membrane protein (DUF441 family)
MHLFAQLDPDNAEGLVRLLVDAATSRNWPLLVAVAVVLIVYLLRRFALGGLSERWPWLGNKGVTLALVVLVSAAVTVGTGLLAGVPLSLGLVIGAVVTAALSAVGLHSGGKNAVQAFRPPPPTAALSAVIGRLPGEPMRGPQP